jgi:two-component system sensor histidine kinase MtrB
VKPVPSGLRARTATAFALLALVLSASLSVVTYQLTRQYLIDQRTSLAVRQASTNALVARGVVAAAGTRADLGEVLRTVSNARALLRTSDGWFSAVVELGEGAVPGELVDAVARDEAARQRVALNDVPYLVVGVPLPGLEVDYFEFASLAELQRTLNVLGAVLVVAASLTTVIGALVGWRVSRRVLRPLADVGAVAAAMAEGDLGRRLDAGSDPDLQPMVDSFNEMAGALEERIDRELRFTADVSHELRTPLTAMASAVSLAKRAGPGDRGGFAIEVLEEQVLHLQRLTLELLEISRIDAGVVDLRLEPTDVVSLVERRLAAQSVDPSVLSSRLGSDPVHVVDPVRFERIVDNLVENAIRHGGGPTSVELSRSGTALVLLIDDAGPGIPPSERVAVFGRFHRGGSAQPIDLPKGTGLGLALVDEHVKLHGGQVWIEGSHRGGARFVVSLPAAEDGDEDGGRRCSDAP